MTDQTLRELPEPGALGEWPSPEPTSTGDGDSETPISDVRETTVTLRGVAPADLDDSDVAQLRQCIENTLLTAGYPLEAVEIEGQEQRRDV